MIITVGNTKGGVGKTTLAVNLAIARAIAGHEVWLIDGDRQGTAQMAITLRAEAGRTPGIACAGYPEGSMLRTQVLQQQAKFDDIIIDAGGRDSSALRAALVIADVVLVPFQPRSYDVWALQDMAALISEANEIRANRDKPPLKSLACINGADSGKHAPDNQEAAQAVSEAPPLVYLPALMHRRKSYANAAGSGLSVLEATPRDKKACDELNHLVSMVFSY